MTKRDFPVVMDVHVYQVFGRSNQRRTFDAHMVRTKWSRRLLRLLSSQQPVMVGEWSAMLPQKTTGTVQAVYPGAAQSIRPSNRSLLLELQDRSQRSLGLPRYDRPRAVTISKMSVIFKRTKILATVGPAVDSYEQIGAMARAGVNGFRLNFSHADHGHVDEQIEWIRKASEAVGKPVAILQDLQGPKVRLGALNASEVAVRAGDTLTLDYSYEHEDGLTLRTVQPGRKSEAR